MARDEKNKRPYVLLYINDFLSSPFVQEMNDSQRVWYIWLLMRAWQSSDPCYLENDDEKLRINAGCKSKAKWRKHKQLVLNCFTHDEPKNSLTHWRLLDQYDEMMESVERKRVAGLASATARQQKATAVEQPSTLHLQPHLHTTEEPKPIASSPLDSPLVVGIPLNDGSEFEVLQSLVDEMASLYPAVDVVQEFRSMRAWSLANRPKRKTRSGILRFANNWLSKAQDKGGRENSNHGTSKAAERVSKNREVITQVLGGIARRDGAVPQDGSERIDSEGLVRGLKPVLGSGDP